MWKFIIGHCTSRVRSYTQKSSVKKLSYISIAGNPGKSSYGRNRTISHLISSVHSLVSQSLVCVVCLARPNVQQAGRWQNLSTLNTFAKILFLKFLAVDWFFYVWRSLNFWAGKHQSAIHAAENQAQLFAVDVVQEETSSGPTMWHPYLPFREIDISWNYCDVKFTASF